MRQRADMLCDAGGMAKRTEEQVVAELAAVEEAIAACDSGENYRRRLQLLEEALALGLTVGRVAEAVGQREGTYRQALHKDRRRRAEASA